jgi:hypothetical protein
MNLAHWKSNGSALAVDQNDDAVIVTVGKPDGVASSVQLTAIEFLQLMKDLNGVISFQARLSREASIPKEVA